MRKKYREQIARMEQAVMNMARLQATEIRPIVEEARDATRHHTEALVVWDVAIKAILESGNANSAALIHILGHLCGEVNVEGAEPENPYGLGSAVEGTSPTELVEPSVSSFDPDSFPFPNAPRLYPHRSMGHTEHEG